MLERAGHPEDGSLKYGVPIYVNQPVIFQHKVAVDDWRGGVMRPAPEHWTVHEYPNEVGSYRRTFTVPEEWKGREVYINFDGVDSFFYLWVNGQYVGFSKNSRNTASFDITDKLVKGENTVAVEVYRSSDASFLESQDMFRLPGIIRSTYLTSTPKVQIRDLVIHTTTGGKVTADATVRNLSKKDAKKLFDKIQCISRGTVFRQNRSRDRHSCHKRQIHRVEREQRKPEIGIHRGRSQTMERRRA